MKGKQMPSFSSVKRMETSEKPALGVRPSLIMHLQPFKRSKARSAVAPIYWKQLQ
jgi:hypothetical protein